MIWLLARLLLGGVLVALACAIAGAYGMAHNQISYLAAPTYFHDLKFPQFGIDLGDRNAWGAAIVGFRASWWMGGILGITLLLLGFRLKSHKIFASAFIRSALLIVIITLALGVLALIAAQQFLSEAAIPSWLPTHGSDAPLQFAQVAIMHETSYLGAGISLLIAIFTVQRRAYKRDQRRGFPF